jgi:hypothetical protein
MWRPQHLIRITVVAMTFDVFAREELESFFGRREERGKYYCRACLVQQLILRGTGKIAAAAWTAATDEAFMQPRLLQVRSDRPCEICKESELSIGMEWLDSKTGDQAARGRLIQ